MLVPIECNGKKSLGTFLIFLGLVALSITCIEPVNASDITVSVNETNIYRDFQVYSIGGNYVIRAIGSDVDYVQSDPVVQLYRGTTITGIDYDYSSPTSVELLGFNNDGGNELGDASGTGWDSYLSGTVGAGNYVIRVISEIVWYYPGEGSYDEVYTFSFTGFFSGTTPAPAPAPAPVYVRQTNNLSFAQSLHASDTLSDPDGQLRKTVDQIMDKYGSLIK
jgi:hypothetical protein